MRRPQIGSITTKVVDIVTKGASNILGRMLISCIVVPELSKPFCLTTRFGGMGKKLLNGEEIRIFFTGDHLKYDGSNIIFITHPEFEMNLFSRFRKRENLIPRETSKRLHYV